MIVAFDLKKRTRMGLHLALEVALINATTTTTDITKVTGAAGREVVD